MATRSTTTGSAARNGVVAMLPLLAGYMPFALVIGSAAADRGTPLAGWAGSWLILAGSAHLAAMRTLDDAGVVAAILTGLLINARLLVYSASLARRWAGQPRWFRFAAAGLIIDPTWAVADRHADQAPTARDHRHYFLGAALTLAVGWSAAMAVGAVLGARLDGLDLQIAVPLCLLSLAGPSLRSGPARPVVAVAAVVALVTADWPSGTGLLAAVAAGSVTSLALEHRRPS